MAVEQILGQYEANAIKSQTGTDRVATDKDTFLKLLVAQLTHQDPLNPVEDKEFIAQLAQFTTVEELQNMNKGMESLNSAYLRQQSVSAAGLIGRYVQAPGDQVTVSTVKDAEGKDQRYSTSIDFELPRDAPSVRIDIYSLDSEGNPLSLVASEEIEGGLKAGKHNPQWQGVDSNGNPVPDGIYAAVVVAADVDGQPIYVTPTSTGRVVRVEMADDGNHKLVLGDGRSVYFNDVKVVDDAAVWETADSSGADSGSTSNGSGGTGTGTTDTGTTGTGGSDTGGTGTGTTGTGTTGTGTTGTGTTGTGTTGTGITGTGGTGATTP